MYPYRPALVLVALSVCLVILGGAVGRAGFWYGQAWLEWDSQGASYFYTERPGGFLVLLVTQAWMLIVFIAAAGLVILAVTRWYRQSMRYRRRADEV
ncbi:hypothetical protein B7R21_08500 [Subtercola boreus]|uniref:Uncharacterized protein n=1 Tax=Subtercola boreus TaxID=120213 RepID=A0A3E0VV36_9MICO|nr:hypothetical protein [Subtercola boreus]RFA13248.1 hypothetical protein B7R21_08500 [Subtercola boreus]